MRDFPWLRTLGGPVRKYHPSSDDVPEAVSRFPRRPVIDNDFPQWFWIVFGRSRTKLFYFGFRHWCHLAAPMIIAAEAISIGGGFGRPFLLVAAAVVPVVTLMIGYYFGSRESN